jgi:hypothetical protein
VNDNSLTFHIAEYTSLRQEIYESAKIRYQSLVYTFIANAFVFGWVTSQRDDQGLNNIISIAASAPIIISLSGWLISTVRLAQIKRIGEYCLLVENKFGCSDLGWEKYYSQRMSAVSFYVFTILYLVQLGLAVYFFLTTASSS